MSHFDWTRAAYVMFALAVLSALVKVGSMTLADPSALAPRSANASPMDNAEEAFPGSLGSFLDLDDGRGLVGRAAQEGAAVGESGDRAPESTDREGTSTPERDAPVFYRPAKPEEKGPVCGDLSGVPGNNKAVFPLARGYSDSYSDTWGAPRPQGGHEGADLMVPAGTPEYAVTSGTVVPVSGANGNGWNTLGGYTLMLRADYSVGPIHEGDLFYYAHMDEESSLPIGSRVSAGQVVGYAGDTGEGPEATRGLFPPHLHLGWYDMSSGRSDLASGAMNPYPLLEWLQRYGGSVSGGSDASFCEAPQTGQPSPSGGEGSWRYPSQPGEQPDLDTGAESARPSPAVHERGERGEEPATDAPPANNDEDDASGPDEAGPDRDPPVGGRSATDLPDSVRGILAARRDLDTRIRAAVERLMPGFLSRTQRERPEDRPKAPAHHRDEDRDGNGPDDRASRGHDRGDGPANGGDEPDGAAPPDPRDDPADEGTTPEITGEPSVDETTPEDALGGDAADTPGQEAPDGDAPDDGAGGGSEADAAAE